LPQKQLPNFSGADVVFVGNLSDGLIRRGLDSCLAKPFQCRVDIQIGFPTDLSERLLSKSSAARTITAASAFTLPSASATLAATLGLSFSGGQQIQLFRGIAGLPGYRSKDIVRPGCNSCGLEVPQNRINWNISLFGQLPDSQQFRMRDRRLFRSL
jgi:hypothetical protein